MLDLREAPTVGLHCSPGPADAVDTIRSRPVVRRMVASIAAGPGGG